MATPLLPKGASTYAHANFGWPLPFSFCLDGLDGWIEICLALTMVTGTPSMPEFIVMLPPLSRALRLSLQCT